jgi:hypothetical protein
MQSALPIAIVSFLGTLIYLIIFFTLHFLPTGYNPIRNAVSDYGVGKYSPLFRVALWSSSVGVLTLAIALAVGVGAPPLVSRYLLYMGLITVARIAMSLFPTDLEGKGLTFIGILHYAFAIAAFTLTYMTISNLTPELVMLSPWTMVQQPLTFVAGLVEPALIMVVVTMFRPLRRIFGLFERIFLLSTNVWFLLVTILLLVKTF